MVTLATIVDLHINPTRGDNTNSIQRKIYTVTAIF